jgi:putative transcriptional regulator
VLRAERDWTQAELAAYVGVTRQTINSIEKGRFHPNLRLAFKIARIFDTFSLREIKGGLTRIRSAKCIYVWKCGYCSPTLCLGLRWSEDQGTRLQW